VATGDIQMQNTHAAAEQFARWRLAPVLERVLVPSYPRQTEADCSAWVGQVLSALGISTGAHNHALCPVGSCSSSPFRSRAASSMSRFSASREAVYFSIRSHSNEWLAKRVGRWMCGRCNDCLSLCRR
jgi:hypothetical protein